jgi:lipopolysaccharide transport system permease protein
VSAGAGKVAELTAQRGYRIEPARRGFALDWRELLAYRELLYVLVWRDLKIRYQQTLIGVGWAVLQPLVAMLVFTVVFNRLGGLEPEYHVPYPLFVTTGLLPWFFFSTALSKCTQSVVLNAELVGRVYFPRLIIPIGSVLAALVDFVVSFVLLIGLFGWYGRLPHWHALFTPVFVGLAFFSALGIGLWFSALNVRYRDVGYIANFLTQMLLFLSPIAYGATAVQPGLRWLIALNPMTGVIDGFRWALLGGGTPHYTIYAISGCVTAALCLSGLWYFQRVERDFADVI